MNPTKLSRIIAAVLARLERATIANGFQTDIGATVYDWPIIAFETAPTHCAAYLVERTVRASAEVRHICEAQIEIEAHHEIGDESRAALAAAVLGDIQKAVEADLSDGLAALLKGPAAPVWVSDSVDYSDAAGEFVSVRSIYSVPHVRRRADPEEIT